MTKRRSKPDPTDYLPAPPSNSHPKAAHVPQSLPSRKPLFAPVLVLLILSGTFLFCMGSVQPAPNNTPTITFTPTETFTPTITPTPSDTPTVTLSPTTTDTPTVTPTLNKTELAATDRAHGTETIAARIENNTATAAQRAVDGTATRDQRNADGTTLAINREGTATAYALNPPPVVRATSASRNTPIGVGGGTGPTGKCRDGTLSFAANRQGACSRHGGVAEWYK